jgi:hypothetical protein
LWEGLGEGEGCGSNCVTFGLFVLYGLVPANDIVSVRLFDVRQPRAERRVFKIAVRANEMTGQSNRLPYKDGGEDDVSSVCDGVLEVIVFLVGNVEESAQTEAVGFEEVERCHYRFAFTRL